jgi:glycosyltransferase involved in cell wall biosynthesis
VRVVLDARLTRQMSVGMQSYVRELVRRLPSQCPGTDFVVLTNRLSDLDVNHGRAIVIADAVARNGGFGEQCVLPRIVRRLQPDLVHFLSVYMPRAVGCAAVCTIHDLIHLRFPAYASWKVPLYYRFVVGPAVRRAQCIITDAQATVADLERFLGVPPERVAVVPLGCDERYRLTEEERLSAARCTRERFGLQEHFFVYAGNHRPHKNISTLVAAWRAVRAACDLVLTEDGPFDCSLETAPKTNGRILTPGRVSTDELAALYAGCTAAVVPSLYEGFGLGAVEAMAAGAPVIVARTPALLEVADGAALTFEPLDAAALTRHMESLIDNETLRARLHEAGRRRSTVFSWDQTARATARIYAQLMSR